MSVPNSCQSPIPEIPQTAPQPVPGYPSPDEKKTGEEKMMNDMGRESIPSPAGNQGIKGKMGEKGGYDDVDRRALSLDPKSCFFEEQFYAHNEQWVPQFDKACTVCQCVVS